MQKQVETVGRPGSSGAVRVTDPNELGTLLNGQLQMKTDGWLHVYAGNGFSWGSEFVYPMLLGVNAPNFCPDARARNQGLRSPLKAQFTLVNEHFRMASITPISSFSAGRALGHGKKYKNMYTGKELQTGEYWKAWVSSGLEMYDYSLSLFPFKGARETASLSFEARFFDPQLGRWIVPDPAEQFSNPYLGIRNNPPINVDLDGQFLAIPALIVSWTADFISNVFNGKSDAAGLAYENATNTINGMNNALQIPIHQSDNTSISVGINPFSVGISVNITHKDGDMEYNLSAGFDLMSGPYVSGGVPYNPDEWSIGIGGGIGDNTYSYGASAKHNSYGGGHYRTTHGDAIGPKGNPNLQTVGGISIHWPGGSFRLENDYLAFKGEDRWRSNAFELTLGEFSIGSTIYNNDPEGEGLGQYKDINDPIARNKRGKPNRPNKINYTAWKNSQTCSANFWGGYNFGNHIERFGFSNPWVQDLTQNTVHRWLWFGRQNYYNKYDYFNDSAYFYGGYNNPYSLWGR